MSIREDRSVRVDDVDELLQTSEPVLLAVDQVPFEVESRGVRNTFCLLVPLLTESGVEISREQFSNRERVWWMLRSDIPPEEIRVGMIWSGPIERSREYGSSEREKDHYQVRRSAIKRSFGKFVEVLNHKVADPDLTELLDPEGIPWPYPPLQRVVVRGGLSVLGPFRSSYNYETSRVVLQALTPGSPSVFRMTRAEFESEVSIRDYSYTANQWDAKAQPQRLDLSLIFEQELMLLERNGERLDGASEAQVVNWALDLMDVPRKDRELFKQVLAKSGELKNKAELASVPGRLERFLALSENRQRVIDLSAQVAEAVAAQEGFRELVQLHIDSVSEEQVAQKIASRQAEIDHATRVAEERLEELDRRVANRDEEYRAERAAWEAEFQEANKERLARIDERERDLVEEERKALKSLESVAKVHREKSDELADRLLAELPILQRVGLLGGGSLGRDSRFAGGAPGSERSAGPADGLLQLPEWLESPKSSLGMDEEDFLEQFAAVAKGRGFVFDREDLVNFHVLVKTGMWTVLTGPSGLGKSSLPRLYAEALGASDEFLIVPVRPDWLDDRDVVGSFNALTGRYEPAACGLVDRLITAYEDAQRGRGGIYVICLDEMNLARVEHYFAQFLSLLEQPEAERKLKLYAMGLGDAEDPYAPYRSLPLGSNIRFVGTVNVDETTHFFSPKVIDRAPIATFDRPDLRLGLEAEADSDFAGTSGSTVAGIESVTHRVYESWVRPATRSRETVDLLLKIDDAMRESRLGIGFRLRDRILRYVGSACELLGEDRAIDLALLQNLVPRLRPTAPSYPELLGELQSLITPGRFRRTAEILQTLNEDLDSDYFQLL